MRVALPFLALLGQAQIALSCVNGGGANSNSACNVNQYCNGSLAMSCGSTAFGDTREAQYESFPTCNNVSHTAPQLWYHIDVSSELQLRASTCNAYTIWDTQISIFSGASCGNLRCIGGIDDGCANRLQSDFRIPVTAGRYYILVHGYGSKQGLFAMNLQCIYPSPQPTPSRSQGQDRSRSRSPNRSPSKSPRPNPSASRSASRSASPPVCLDTVAGWVDSEGDSCATYQQSEWCTPTGGYGPHWDDSWGVFSDYSNQGGSAMDFCCACGGGNPTVPRPTPSKSPKAIPSQSQSPKYLGSPSPQVCLDTVVDWVDSEGDSCETYHQAEWCTPTGGYGPQWDDSWGIFSDYSNQGGNAADFCCACGGGNPTVPRPTPSKSPKANPSQSPKTNPSQSPKTNPSQSPKQLPSQSPKQLPSASPKAVVDPCGGTCDAEEHLHCNHATGRCECDAGYEMDADGDCDGSSECGSHAIMLNEHCASCVSPCSSCRGAVTYCTACVPGTFLLIDICVEAKGCPAGTVPKDGVCRPCASPCFTCEDEVDECKSCVVGTFLLGERCVLAHECPAGTLAVDGVCRPCVEPCATCNIGLTICTACVPGKFLLNGICVDPIGCPAGTVPEAGLCKPCASPCRYCSGSPTQCTACIDGHFLSGHDCDADDADDCPDGTLAVDGLCAPCVSPCAACSSSLTICTACVSGKYLLNGICVDAAGCPAGTAAEDGLCKPCTSPCTTCSGSTTHCTGCIADRYLLDNTCVFPSQCPSKTVALDRLCRPCVSPCETCVGAVSFCTTCVSGKFLLNEHCVDAAGCPGGTVAADGMCRFISKDSIDSTAYTAMSEATTTRPAWVWVMVAIATVAVAALAVVSWQLYRTRASHREQIVLDELTVEGALLTPQPATDPYVPYPTPVAPDRYVRVQTSD